MHWTEVRERGNIAGIRIMVWIYSVFGRPVFNLVLVPVTIYYFVAGKQARRASMGYLKRLPKNTLNSRLPLWCHSYVQFYRFAGHMLDKIAAMRQHITADAVVFEDMAYIHSEIDRGTGGIIFTSHHGNLDMCRAMRKTAPNFKLTVIVDSSNAVKFGQMSNKLSGAANVEFRQVKSFSPATIIELKEIIERGEFVAISADRAVKEVANNVLVDFLGHTAALPKGPFLIQQLLSCHAYFMSCISKNGQPTISFHEIAQAGKQSRRMREQAIYGMALKYAELLQQQVLQSPYEWFNFFDFWSAETQYQQDNEAA